MENKGVGFTAQQVMDSVLDDSKVPVTIQSYDKAQSYPKSTGTPSHLKDTRRACRRAAASVASSTSKEFYGLKTNDDGNFKLDGKFYPFKEFAQEEIILGGYLRFLGVHAGREIWGYQSIRTRRTRTEGRIKNTAET